MPLFSSPMAKSNFRPLGTKCYPRVPPSLFDGTISESHTQYTCVRYSSQLNRRGSQRNETKRVSSCSSQLSPPGRFCQFSFSSSQKGRRSTPSYQSQRAKSILRIPTFQNGWYSHVAGSPQRKRPPGKDRFKRRILYHSNLEEPSKVSQIPLERYPPGIHVPPHRASFGTPCVYQDSNTSRSTVAQTGCTSDYLFGRHPDHGRVCRASQNPCQPGSQLASQLGLCDQPQKVNSNSQSTVRISGVHSHLSNYDSVPNPRQTSSNQERESILAEQQHGICKRTLSVSREAKCIHSGSFPCSPELPSPAEGKTSSSQSFQGLRSISNLHPKSQRGIDLVARQPTILEWQKSSIKMPRYSYRDRCFISRLGGSLWGPSHRGTLVSDRAFIAHKLPGADSGRICLEIIRKRQVSYQSPSVNGQPDISRLPKQNGGHILMHSRFLDLSNMAVVSQQRHNNSRTTPTRVSKCNSRRGVPIAGRLQRLETHARNIPANKSALGSSRNRPFCLSANQPTPSLCELEARPRSRGDRCLLSKLGPTQRLCIPAIRTDRALPQTGAFVNKFQVLL